MASMDVQQRGTQLHADLEQAYRDLSEAKQLGAASLSGIDVSQTVSRSMPVGTPFQDAAKILRAAGFNLAPDPPRPLREGTQGVEAALRFTIMGQVVLAEEFGYKASVSVTLHPDSPGDPAAHVKEVRALLRTSHI